MTEQGRRSTVHPDAHALTLFRALKNGNARAYTAVTFPHGPWQGCERLIRTARAFGFLGDAATEGSYGVLDVLNEDGDIVQDFAVRDPSGFRWLKRRLDLRVESEDGSADPANPVESRGGDGTA